MDLRERMSRIDYPGIVGLVIEIVIHLPATSLTLSGHGNRRLHNLLFDGNDRGKGRKPPKLEGNVKLYVPDGATAQSVDVRTNVGEDVARVRARDWSDSPQNPHAEVIRIGGMSNTILATVGPGQPTEKILTDPADKESYVLVEFTNSAVK